MMSEFSFLGVDLAGVPHRPTGLCLLNNMDADTKLVYTDDEILSVIDRPEYSKIDRLKE